MKPTRRLLTTGLASAVLATLVGAPAVASTPSPVADSPTVSVIVREASGAGDAPERHVRRLGGTVDRQIALIGGFSASLPASAVATMRALPEVTAVTEDAVVRLSGYDGFEPKSDFGSMYYVAQEVSGAGEYWNSGFRGQGVDVAVIDSGVAEVDGLRAPGKVVHGPDLSFESQSDTTRYVDTFGHGTHMAGIIAGRDDAAPTPVQKGEENAFVGMAPEARIVSVKVADRNGATDVSQVLAAIDWVVQHRSDPGMNIRVLNLSFGTDGVQDYQLDPSRTPSRSPGARASSWWSPPATAAAGRTSSTTRRTTPPSWPSAGPTGGTRTTWSTTSSAASPAGATRPGPPTWWRPENPS